MASIPPLHPNLQWTMPSQPSPIKREKSSSAVPSQLSPQTNTSTTISIGYTYEARPRYVYHVRTKTCRLRKTKVPTLVPIEMEAMWKPLRLKAEDKVGSRSPELVVRRDTRMGIQVGFYPHHKTPSLSLTGRSSSLSLCFFPSPHGSAFRSIDVQAAPGRRRRTRQCVRHVDFGMQNRAIETRRLAAKIRLGLVVLVPCGPK